VTGRTVSAETDRAVKSLGGGASNPVADSTRRARFYLFQRARRGQTGPL
jgi:hypothetical protein